MKTLKFTDPNQNYEGFKDVEVKVDLISLQEDNCTVYEVKTEDLPLSVEIGLDILVPSQVTLSSLKGLANSLGLKLESVEDAEDLTEGNIILSNFTVTEDGGTDGLIPSTGLILTFDQSMIGLTDASVNLVGATVSSVEVVPGSDNKEWKVLIEDITVPNNGLLEISLERWTDSDIVYGPLNNAVVEVFNTLPLEITYTAEQQVGVSGTVTTTGVLFTFSETVPGLTAAKITLTGATKGVLTDNEDGSYLLAINTITVANGENITVDIADWPVAGILYTVTTEQPLDVEVFKAA